MFFQKWFITESNEVEVSIQKILKQFPTAKLENLPAQNEIPRYRIHLPNDIIINFGGNAHFFKNNVLVSSLKNAALLSPTAIIAWVNQCYQNFQNQTQLKKIPQVKSLIKKYLGQEDKYEINKDGTEVRIFYPKFFIILSGHQVSIVLKSDNRSVLSQQFTDEGELEAIFKTASYYADSINKGQL